jgi:nucleoside-diphosphate-sugar epimerase
MNSAPKVLLTGTTGFIGRHLAKALASAGHDVTSLQRSAEKLPGITGIIQVHELGPDAISRALAGQKFDWLFHLAGYGVNPLDREIEPMFRINVAVLQRLVEEAASWPARAVVVTGTGAEYDFKGVSFAVPESHPLETHKLYGASKAAGTISALAIGRALNIPLVVARMFGVFGFGEAHHRLLPTLVRHLRSGSRVPLTDGMQERDNLYIRDAISVLIELASAVQDSPKQIVVNVGSGKTPTVRMFAELVAEVLEAPTSLLGFGDVPMRPDETHCFCGDIRRLHEIVDWRPMYSLADGIREAVQGYLEPNEHGKY